LVKGFGSGGGCESPTGTKPFSFFEPAMQPPLRKRNGPAVGAALWHATTAGGCIPPEDRKPPGCLAWTCAPQTPGSPSPSVRAAPAVPFSVVRARYNPQTDTQTPLPVLRFGRLANVMRIRSASRLKCTPSSKKDGVWPATTRALRPFLLPGGLDTPLLCIGRVGMKTAKQTGRSRGWESGGSS
jgi:hypothetical protein